MKILAIHGSATPNSSNFKILLHIKRHLDPYAQFEIFDRLGEIPHFDPFATEHHTHQLVTDIRNQIEKADLIIFCSPEYIFSIPSRMKNLIEWCVSTTVFSEKPVSIITASAHGEKAHKEMQLILSTLYASVSDDRNLLIQAVRGKIDSSGNICDSDTRERLENLLENITKEFHLPV